MQLNNLAGTQVLVVGAGIMGVGIAQVAAQAGHMVWLQDTRPGAAAQAKDKLSETLAMLVSKGKLQPEVAAQTLARITPIDTLEPAARAGLVVEAIVESLAAKRALFQQLETLVTTHCILATNTSSISVTAIANGLQEPSRLVGMHFFNPVPLMKLVEVVSGLQTAAVVADAIFALCQQWGKVPVHARSTPGFIVNRIARPYYAESLALLQEQATTPAELDACWRGAGFRMGPCELMDLIGHDTNFAVTQSVFEANFYDKRYVPSLVQREMVDGGLLGRKSGRGFFSYGPGVAKPQVAEFEVPAFPAVRTLCLHGQGAVADQLAAALSAAGQSFVRAQNSDWIGLEVDGHHLRLTDGRAASFFGPQTAVFDLPLQARPGAVLAWAPSASASPTWVAQASQCLQALDLDARQMADVPGLVVARTVAMLINEASDAVHQGVCTAQGADDAMQLGVNYPAGPFQWLAQWGAPAVVHLLDHLDVHYRGERYRVSPGLRHRVWQAAV